MKNTFGNSVSITIFGESHGSEVGVILDGIAPGIKVDTDFIVSQMDKRRAKGELSTKRIEADEVIISSGVFNGRTTGTPICLTVKNTNTQSKDYSETRNLARPGHADYTANCKYHGFEDFRGGGHFSGRVTAPLVAAGAIALSALKEKGISIGTHIKKCAGIADRDFADISTDIKTLENTDFAVFDEASKEKMIDAIKEASKNGDSVGGILETAIIGLPEGLGEPWFDSFEGVLSHILFSVPGIKGVQFGKGFEMADMLGSEANDQFEIKDGEIVTKTNNNGGINGGITNGMPVIFSCAVKPTPSIYKKQDTVDFINKENTEIEIKGRHDPAIIHRARVVVDSVVALAVCDILALRYGTDYLKGNS